MSTDTPKSDRAPRKSRVFTRGRPFPPGNPGRPKGTLNKVTTMLEALFAGEADDIGRRTVELAKEGQVGAIKLVLDRACPPRKVRHVENFALPALNTVADAAAAMGQVAAAATAGRLAVEDARDLADIIDTFRKARELGDIETRLTKVEQNLAKEAEHGQAR